MLQMSRWSAPLLGLGLSLGPSGCTERLIVDDDPFGASDSSTETTPDDGVPLECGDGAAQGTEDCDGLDLRGVTCEALGLGSGTLACRIDCKLEIGGCSAPGCGNGVVDFSEVCDGLDLAGQSCASLGFPGGTLACAAGCSAFDFSGCVQTVCGNGLLEAGEACDGADLAGLTCTALGLDPGQLLCAPDCLDFDVLGCGTGCADSDLGGAVGPAVAAGNTNGDDDDLPLDCAEGGGADHVLRFVPPIPGEYAFDTVGSNYDTALSIFASCHPSSALVCNDDFDESLQSRVSAVLDVDREVFVTVDGFFGDTGDWVLNITPPSIPPPPSCTELDLGWVTGNGVAAGDITLEDDDLPQGCAANGGADHVIRFIAPASGLYTIDTSGSFYDTALSIHTSCNPGSEIACNDDYEDLTSRIDIQLTAGQSVLIAVGGFDLDTGPWVLDIDGP